MTAITKVGQKYQIVIPKKLREAAKLKIGDFLEVRLGAGARTVIFEPKILVERDTEINKELALALEDVRRGRVIGPFNSAAEMITDLHKRVARHTKKKT